MKTKRSWSVRCRMCNNRAEVDKMLKRLRRQNSTQAIVDLLKKRVKRLEKDREQYLRDHHDTDYVESYFRLQEAKVILNMALEVLHGRA